VLLVLMPVAGSKQVYRRTNVALPEGSSFVGAAVALCVAGAVLDVAAT
jgi:hypothetical protein